MRRCYEAFGGNFAPPEKYEKCRDSAPAPKELGLYYLQSRYYDPELCRFLNADAFISTGQGELGNNMFAYCRNNPVHRIDISGANDVDCYDEDGELFSGDDIKHRASGADNGIGGVGRYSSGFRGKLQRFTGNNGNGRQAHHVFPRRYVSQFKNLGINIEDPKYGAWWENSAHQSNSYEYNQWWAAFFNTKDVNAETAKMLAQFLAALFGFELNF